MKRPISVLAADAEKSPGELAGDPSSQKVCQDGAFGSTPRNIGSETQRQTVSYKRRKLAEAADPSSTVGKKAADFTTDFVEDTTRGRGRARGRGRGQGRGRGRGRGEKRGAVGNAIGGDLENSETGEGEGAGSGTGEQPTTRNPEASSETVETQRPGIVRGRDVHSYGAVIEAEEMGCHSIPSTGGRGGRGKCRGKARGGKSRGRGRRGEGGMERATKDGGNHEGLGAAEEASAEDEVTEAHSGRVSENGTVVQRVSGKETVLKTRGRGRGRGKAGNSRAPKQKSEGIDGYTNDGFGASHIECQGGTGQSLPKNADEARSKWLGEISVIRDWQSYLQLPLESPELHIADDFGEGHMGFTLPLFKAAFVSDTTSAREQSSAKSFEDVILNSGGLFGHWIGALKDLDGPYGAQTGKKSLEQFPQLGEAVSGRGVVQIWAVDIMPSTSDHRSSFPMDDSSKRKRASAAQMSESEQSGGMRSYPDLNSSAVLHNSKSCGGPPEACDAAYEVNLPSVRAKTKERLKDKARAKAPLSQSRGHMLPDQSEKQSIAPITSRVDFRLPGMVFGLAHDGLLTWDAKWRPVEVPLGPNYDEREIWRLGYLAMALGNGSVEVFDVPLPDMLEVGTLFLRLEPIFRCSELRSGGQKSMPLAVEWSPWAPYNLLLAGCHDGSVAVWKFQSSTPSGQETRPLMSFVADSFPIRAVAWAPEDSGSVGKHLIATTGHSGYVRFWDIREPFRPIWDLQVSKSWILGLHWLGNQRCLLLSLDDGTLRVLNLKNTIPDFPATCNLAGWSQSQNLHSYFCSSFPIWGVQACQTTNTVAYCGTDGSVLQFLLTEKAIERDAARNRAPHFLVGAYAANSETGPLLIVPEQRSSPVQMRKTPTEWSTTPVSKRGFLSNLNHVLRASGGQYLPPPRPGVAGKTKGSKVNSKSPQANQPREEDADPGDIELTNDLENSRDLPQTSAKVPPAVQFPPKIVSVQRLRWNCNKNGGDWLAYGGRAGIVRCQRVGLT